MLESVELFDRYRGCESHLKGSRLAFRAWFTGTAIAPSLMKKSSRQKSARIAAPVQSEVEFISSPLIGIHTEQRPQFGPDDTIRSGKDYSLRIKPYNHKDTNKLCLSM